MSYEEEDICDIQPPFFSEEEDICDRGGGYMSYEEEDTCDIQPPFFSGILPLLISMRTQRVPNV